MASVVSQLEVLIRGNTSDLKRKLNQADQQTEDFATRTRRRLRQVALVGAGLVLAAGAFAVNAAIEWEQAFTNVTKTVDGTTEEIDNLEVALRRMATSEILGGIENAHTVLANIAALGGQLGVPVADLENFTQVIGEMTLATDLKGGDAAKIVARFFVVTGTDLQDVRKYGNAIVALGNNFAASESEIANFAKALQPLAAFDFSPDEILGWATAMTALDINPEAGGTAFIKVAQAMIKAVSDEGGDLQKFADVTGLAADEFAELVTNDPSAAMEAFVGGLTELDKFELGALFEDLGFADIRTQKTFLTVKQGADTATEALRLSNSEWHTGNALQEEAAKFADTTGARIERLKNNINDAGIALGARFLPHINRLIEHVLDGDGMGALGDFANILLEVGGALVGLVIPDFDMEAVRTTIGQLGTIMEPVERDFSLFVDHILLTLGELALGINEAAASAGLADLNTGLQRDVVLTRGRVQGFDAVDALTDALAAANVGDGDLSEILSDQFHEWFGQTINLADLIGLTGTLPESAGVEFKAAVGTSLRQALEGGDASDLALIIPMAEALELNMEGVRPAVAEALVQAISGGDEGAIEVLTPIANDLDIDLAELHRNMTNILEGETYEAVVVADITVVPGNVDTTRIGAAVGGAAGGSGGGGGGDTYIVNSHGQNTWEQVEQMQQARADQGRGGGGGSHIA